MNQSSKTIFKDKHIFLLGLEDQNKLKEYLATSHISFQVHDRNQVKSKDLTDEEQYIHIEEKDPIITEEEDPKLKKKQVAKASPVKKEEGKKGPVKGKPGTTQGKPIFLSLRAQYG